MGEPIDGKSMVFQIRTKDDRILTVHTEVDDGSGMGLTRVIVEEVNDEKQTGEDADSGKGSTPGE